MSAENYKYSKHPSLKFALKSIKDTATSLGATSYGVSQMPQLAPLHASDLRDLIDNGDSKKVKTMARQITAYGRNVCGAPAYWWGRRYEVDAHVKRRSFYKNELPIVFFSGSFAEYHWPELHRILELALRHAGQVSDADAVHPLAVGSEATDKARVHRILLENLVLQNEVFVLRTQAWFKIVIEGGLNINEHWRRYEFAASRGTIHFHAIGWSDECSTRLHTLLDAAMGACDMGQLTNIEGAVAKAVHEELPKVLAGFTAEHPSGTARTPLARHADHETHWYTNRKRACELAHTQATREALRLANPNAAPAPEPEKPEETQFREKYCVTGHDVDWAGGRPNIGNIDRWVPHEGMRGTSYAEADRKPLRTKIYEIADGVGMTEIADLIHFVNCVLVHSCSSYCLRDTGRKKKHSDGTPMRVYECRFHFGEQNSGVTARSDGRACHKDPLLETWAGITMFAPPRDCPRLVAGPHRLCRGYGGNSDMQLLLAPRNDVPEHLLEGEDQTLDGTIITRVEAYLDNITLPPAAAKEREALRRERQYAEPWDGKYHQERKINNNTMPRHIVNCAREHTHPKKEILELARIASAGSLTILIRILAKTC